MLNTMSDFTDWLNAELNTRGWGYNELARRAGLSSGGVSIVMTERQRPGWEFCTKIADALVEKPERVLRLAGLLRSEPPSEATVELRRKLEYALDLLNDEHREEAGVRVECESGQVVRIRVV